MQYRERDPMKRVFRRINHVLCMLGIDLLRFAFSIRYFGDYYRDFKKIKKQKKNSKHEFFLRMSYPCLSDKFSKSGSIKGHYFHQDLFVAQRIFRNNPCRHVDVGSRIDGFVAHVASYRPIEVIDIRPLSSQIRNVLFKQANMMDPLPTHLYGYCDSLSCLHTIEHFGLGRYGDPINYEGYIAGLENLYLMLQKGGKLYLSVPIGIQRIEFNAHRIFSTAYLLDLLAKKYFIEQFSYIDDQGNLHEDVPITDQRSVQNNFACRDGCGIFEMTKKQTM